MRETTNLCTGNEIINIKRQVKGWLGRVVQIRVCRFNNKITWALTLYIKKNSCQSEIAASLALVTSNLPTLYFKLKWLQCFRKNIIVVISLNNCQEYDNEYIINQNLVLYRSIYTINPILFFKNNTDTLCMRIYSRTNVW